MRDSPLDCPLPEGSSRLPEPSVVPQMRPDRPPADRAEPSAKSAEPWGAYVAVSGATLPVLACCTAADDLARAMAMAANGLAGTCEGV